MTSTTMAQQPETMGKQLARMRHRSEQFAILAPSVPSAGTRIAIASGIMHDATAACHSVTQQTSNPEHSGVLL
jgi:hypothetical protein